MDKFKTGNVVRLHNEYGKGSVVVITEVRDDITHFVFIDASNCSGALKNKTYKASEMCWNCNTNDDPDGNGPDYDCENCHGSGEYMKTWYGMDKAKYLADNVKDYILDRLTKKFNF